MASTKITTSTIGFPRIGPKREMKTALEKYWKGQSSQNDLLATTQAVQAEAWRQQQDAGVELVGVDGTLYDQVLDTVFMLGVIPKRFQHLTGYDQYFAMARGALGSEALDMSKFFDTNYHFMVPELEDGWTPRPNFTHILDKIQRCQAVVGKAAAVPIVIGPLTFASLARGPGTSAPVMDIVNKLMPAYVALLEELRRLQVPEAQLHEPYLTTTQGAKLQAEAKAAYTALSAVNVPINLTTYYDDLGAAYPWVITLPVAAISIDFLGCAGASVANQSLALLRTHGFPADKRLGAGIINARSVWADTGVAALLVRELLAAGVKHLSVQPSVPLQHLPLDVSVETQLDPCLRKRLGFAVQKLAEIASTKAEAEAILRAGTLQGDGDLSNFLPKDLPFDNVNAASFDRPEHFNVRRDKQIAMPAFPTTTIGSFPQTADVRRLRLQYKRGTISQQEYDAGIAAQIGFAIGVQEALGLDVFVHGESERTDMVEYFGQSLEGMWFSEQGWVQSYGSRYVRPPLIVGDIRFTKPMTVKEFKVAQSLTKAPVKGMLTGPVTILNWSFPRQDITRRSQAFQLGLAMRQEVKALEDAGCKVVQVDEPALREGLPLKAERWDAYLTWAVDAFRLCCAVAAPATQVVTHLCYSDFQDIMGAIDRMDADVLTIENSRSGDEMIRALAASHYSRDIGPGVYDVHSPVVPTVEFIKTKIRSFMATNILNGRTDRIWVNPDCGLKTRNWEETIPSMRNMVQAAAEMRAELASKGRVSGSAAAPQKGMGGVVPAPGQRVACSPCPCCQ